MNRSLTHITLVAGGTAAITADESHSAVRTVPAGSTFWGVGHGPLAFAACGTGRKESRFKAGTPTPLPGFGVGVASNSECRQLRDGGLNEQVTKNPAGAAGTHHIIDALMGCVAQLFASSSLHPASIHTDGVVWNDAGTTSPSNVCGVRTSRLNLGVRNSFAARATARGTHSSRNDRRDGDPAGATGRCIAA